MRPSLPFLLDIGDLLRELFPLVIFILIGLMALIRRGTETVMKGQREKDGKPAKPPQPLRQEIRRYMEMLDKDLGTGRAAPTRSGPLVTSSPRTKDEDVAPVPRRVEQPIPLPGSPEGEQRVRHPLPIAARRVAADTESQPEPKQHETRHRLPLEKRRGKRTPRLRRPARALIPRRSRRIPDLRTAMMGLEILSPPLAERPPGTGTLF